MKRIFKKIGKNLKMMRLYGAEAVVGAHLEGLFYKLFGKDFWYIRRRHAAKNRKLMQQYEHIKDGLVPADSYAPIPRDGKIWFMWWQGADHYPEAVKVALASIKKNCGQHEVVELSQHNVEQYITIPADIKEKFAQKKISITHYSDIIRFTLLSEYGGIWMDSTLLLARPFPEEFYEKAFFSVKRKEVRNTYISAGRWTTFFVACGKDNILPRFCRDFLIDYWRHNNKLVDYTILDYSLHIGYENVPAMRELIDEVACSNTHVSRMVGLLNHPFDETLFEEMKADTYLFKLSWKETYKKEVDGKETFFGHLVREGL